MKVKAIPSTWLKQEGRRLDCGPYMSGALEAKVILETLPVQKMPLKNVTLRGEHGIVNAGRFRRLWVENEKYGVPFLSSSSILHSDLSNLPLISKKAVEESPQLVIYKGQTLITRSGTIGRMAYTRPNMDGLACSEHVMRVIPDESVIPPGYLYAYLSSKFGVPLVVSGTYGAIIQHIEPHHIADLPVPRLGDKVEKKAHALVEEAAEGLSQYAELLRTATDSLLQTTHVSNPNKNEWFSDKSDLGFSISSKELSVFRAWNHSRRVKRLRDEIQNGKWSRLGDIVSFEWLRWRKLFKRIDADPEFGIEVITQKPLFHLFPEGRWLSREYLLNHSDKYLVPDETILIAKQGTLGEQELYCRCELVTGPRMLEKAYSDHCMRIVAKRDLVDPCYLFAFLRSNTAFRILRALSEGAKQQDLHWRTVPNIPIPRCSERDEKEISDKVRTAFSLRTNAVELLVQARALVEQAIEEAS